ncbi:GIPC PDZ domain containing, member [Schistosoma haematobium]|uniref:protein-tyrosine-phosphatase n=2 Tax=Schistosoma TaxID=6181 RepID=A0A922IKS8_SCHHA|nr:GIPC PDZ domain containing, member [Schistosoma haematobium]KAH9581766.1 GIPC PDZ domain containing, member [Schistosoma haematobium]
MHILFIYFIISSINVIDNTVIDNSNMKCLNQWIKPTEGVAFSLSPCFTCKYSSFQGSMNIKWDCEQSYNLKIKGSIDSIEFDELSNYELRIYRTRENLSQSNTILKAFYITSQRQVSITLTLQLIAHHSMNVQSKLQINFVPILNENKKSFKYFQLYWSTLKQTDFTLFIYNITHTLQYQTHSTSICLENLTEGSQYKFCIVETLYTCKSSSWNCIIKTIPTIQRSINHYRKSINQLQIKNLGYNWLQLTWLPISQTLYWQINEIPMGYLIVAMGKFKTIHCTDRIYSIQAPWAYNSKSIIMSYVQYVYSHNITSKCPFNITYKEINVLSNLWPEWNPFIESQQQTNHDEWGSINEFNIELNQLTPLQEYDIIIEPIFHKYKGIAESITTNKLNPSMDCNLTFEQINHNESFIYWSLPSLIRSNLLNIINNSMYLIEISHIGRPEKNLEKTCFIHSCSMGNSSEKVLNFLPQLENEPQRLNCFTIKLPIYNETTKFTFNCPLIPCKLYEISIRLLYQNQFINEFNCKRRFIRNGLVPKSPSNVYAKVLANNMILFQMNKPNPSTFNHCNTYGYILSFNNNDEYQTIQSYHYRNFTIIHLNDLQNNMNSHLHAYHTMSSDQFFLNNPYPSASSISVRIQSIPMDDKNWIDLNIPLINSNCYLDCIWPNQPPYYRFTQILNHYNYIGQHKSYVIPQTIKNSLQIFQCSTMIDQVNSHSRLCQFNSDIQLSEYTFCMDTYSSIKTCFVPTCDEIAVIPCVTLPKSIIANSSTIQIEWLTTQLSLQGNNSFQLDFHNNDQMKPDSYLVILNQLNEFYGIKHGVCAQYSFVVISKDTHENWKSYFHDLIIQSLIISCLGQTTYSYPELKQSNMIIFDKLIPSTLYEINIIPFNKYGKPGSNWRQEIYTTIAIPCKPDNMEFYKIESHALSIKWYLSRNIYCGYPSRIIVYYKHMNSDDSDNMNEEWYNIDTEYTLEHIRISSLRPCQLYCIKMKFINQAGIGPISNRICNRTKRAAFTNIPILTSQIIQPNKQQTSNNPSIIMLSLQIHLNYTIYCPVQYEFLINIYNDEENPMIIISSNPEVILRNNIQRGMLYQLRGRVRSNESVSTSILHNEMDMFKFSQWAPITLFYANMSHFEFNNFTLNVQRPMEIHKSNGNNDDYYHYQCLFNNEYNNDLSNNSLSPSPPPPLTTTKPPPTTTTTTTMLKTYDFNQYNNNTHYIDRQYSINHSLLNKNSYCLHMKWNISGNLYGLLGFAIQFFIPFNSPNMDDQLHNNMNLLQQCVQFLWLPCNGCLGNYSLRNVHPNVLEKLRKLIDICKLDGNPYQPTLNTYSIQYNLFHDLTNQNSLLSAIDNLQMKLNTLQLNEFNQIAYNETIYKFDYYYYIINPIISIMNSKYSHRSIIVKRDLYSLNQSVSSPSSLPSSSSTTTTTTTISSSSSKTVDSQHSGYVIVYSVTANDVIYSIKHEWRINNELMSSNLLGTIYIVFIVSCLILLLLFTSITIFIVFIIKRNRLNQTKFIGLHTVEYCEDEEDGYELREEYKSPVIPLKIPRQPDPINIHDFMNWSEKNRNSLREEFKSLNIHSYRQEQAKHLTCAIGQRPENRLRNKYRNLLPFDQNYVQLSSALILPESEQINSVDQSKENGVITHNDENTNQNEDIINVSQGLPDIGSEQWIPSNYMNASWIPSKIPGISSTIVSSGQLPCKYIASQAPVDHTRSLFWQMIWDHHVHLIVTLTKSMENGKEKCSVYWPTDSDNDDDTSELYSNKYLQANSKRIVQFGRFKIHLLSKTNYSIYIRRSFKLYDCKTLNNEQYRNIVQLHMLNWPDFSTPSKEDFLRLLYAYWTERRLSMNNSPVLVHCSAGVGRTGTFICLDQLCQQVRYYLQPNLQIFLHKINQINEPIYVNLNKEDSGVDEGEIGDFNEESSSASSSLSSISIKLNNRNENLSSNKQNESMEDHHSTIHENLLHKNSLNISIDNEKRTKRFLFHRRNYNNTQSLNIFNTVLWLRSKRSHMVQTMDQYIFIYECLSCFIKQLKEQNRIYENI